MEGPAADPALQAAMTGRQGRDNSVPRRRRAETSLEQQPGRDLHEVAVRSIG